MHDTRPAPRTDLPALPRTRELIEHLVAYSPFAIAVFDTSSDFICVHHNRAYLDLLTADARRAGTVVGRSLASLLDAASFEAARAVVVRACSRGETVTAAEFPAALAPGGALRYYQWSVSPLSEMGRIAWLVVSAVEVTALVQARERATALAERASRLQLLTASLAAALTPAQVAAVILREGLPTIGATAGSLCMVSEDGAELETIGAAGFAASVVERWSRFPLRSQTPIGDAMSTGQPVLLPSDAAARERYPHRPAMMANSNGQAMAAFPLVVEQRAIGALGLSFAQARDFSTDDVTYIASLAQQAAQALLHARRHEAERQARADVEALLTATSNLGVQAEPDAVIRTLAAQAAQILDAGHASYAIADGEQVRGPGFWSQGEWHGSPFEVAALGSILGHVWSTARPYLCNDLARDPFSNHATDARLGFHSQLVAPVLHPDGGPAGLISVYNARASDGFTARDQRLLVAICAYAGEVLHRAEMQAARLAAEQEAARRRREVEALLNAAEQLNAAVAPDEVLRRVLEVTASLLAVHEISVVTREQRQALLRQRLRHGVWSSPMVQFSLEDTIAGWVIRSGQVYRTDDLAAEQQFHGQLNSAEPGRRLLTVPIATSDGAVLGSLGLVDRLDGLAFTDEDERLAAGIAHHAAVALERARLSHEAEQRAAELSTLLDQMSESVYVFDAAGRLTLLNRAARRHAVDYLGLTSDNLAELAAGILDAARVEFANADGTPFLLQDAAALRALRGEEVSGVILRARYLATALDRYYEVSACPLRDAAGAIAGALSISRDITDAYLAQQEAQRSERLRATGQLAAGLAHDLNNLLGIALGRTEVVIERARRGPLPAGYAVEALAPLRTALLDAAESVRRLQTFARPRDPRALQPLQLEAIAREAAELARPHWHDEAQAQGRPIRLRDQLAVMPPVLGSPAELREAVLNLLINAVAAMPVGGRLTLRTRLDGDHVVLEVTDNGTGMPPAVAARAFEPFFTTKPERGSGLGLAMVHGIVERHGGAVTLRSRPGAGTTVGLRLPRAPSGSVPPATAIAVAPVAGRPLRVLIVDDEPAMRSTLVAMLQTLGHQAITAATAADALACLGRESVDLVLTDQGMPQMTGLELARALHPRLPHLPLVLLTGWGQSLDEAEAQRAGAARLLAKPLSIATLVDLLAWVRATARSSGRRHESD